MPVKLVGTATTTTKNNLPTKTSKKKSDHIDYTTSAKTAWPVCCLAASWRILHRVHSVRWSRPAQWTRRGTTHAGRVDTPAAAKLARGLLAARRPHDSEQPIERQEKLPDLIS